jgi:hypothetical protein
VRRCRITCVPPLEAGSRLPDVFACVPSRNVCSHTPACLWMHVYVHTLMHTGIQLDNAAFMMDRSYKLVVSTPGAKDVLTRDREFVAFKGFPISGTARESQGSWGEEGEESEEGGGRGGAWVVVGRQAEARNRSSKNASGVQKIRCYWGHA